MIIQSVKRTACLSALNIDTFLFAFVVLFVGVAEHFRNGNRILQGPSNPPYKLPATSSKHWQVRLSSGVSAQFHLESKRTTDISRLTLMWFPWYLALRLSSSDVALILGNLEEISTFQQMLVQSLEESTKLVPPHRPPPAIYSYHSTVSVLLSLHFSCQYLVCVWSSFWLGFQRASKGLVASSWTSCHSWRRSMSATVPTIPLLSMSLPNIGRFTSMRIFLRINVALVFFFFAIQDLERKQAAFCI